MLSVSILSTLLAACEVPTAYVPLDSDADGIMDDEEVALGTDPTVEDSDGDTYLDGDEIASYTDPLDANDHPYQAGWPINECRHDLTGTGSTPGSVAYQFELVDQFGETVRLHDFCGQEVLLMFGATT